ncbi:hypothetical protein H1R20_g195, partial [Candolleomyces eurysporus]
MHDSEERYPPPLCHPGTREAVVGRIEAWYGFEIPPEKKIMWVHAPAGYGKSAVAGTVSKNLESRTDLDFNPVGATFFFWRTSPERNSPARFVITLAYQFAMSIPELAPHIETAVKRNPMVLNKTLEAQLTKLIVEPFKSLGQLDSMPHRLVIADGLDECINSGQESLVDKHYAEDQECVQARVLNLIHTLQSHRLPLCFLILSRPEPWIKHQIESKSFQTVTEILDLYEVGDHMKDVEIFVRDELDRIAEGLDPKPDDDEQWPGKGRVQSLLVRTRGHMLYAATVIRHIDVPYDDPLQRLQDLLEDHLYSTPGLAHSSPFSYLFELYRQIIRSCPPTNKAIMGEVLEDILATERYFSRSSTDVHRTLNVLDRISGRPAGRGIKALRSLHAVTCLVGSGSGFFYHSSFPEFLKNHPQPVPDLTVDAQKGVRRLLAGCLKTFTPVALDSEVDEDLRFALAQWAPLWRQWNPSDENDYSYRLKALLSIDLMACFVKDLTVGLDHGPSTLICILGLYDPNKNLLVHSISPPFSSPFIEGAVSHLRLSVEKAFLHILQPDVCESHREALYRYHPATWPSFFLLMACYALETWKQHPTGFASIVRALKTLRLEKEELYEHLEQKISLLFSSLWSEAGNISELVRQDGEL